MSHTITITLDDATYHRLQEQFGEGGIERAVEGWLRPYTMTEAELDAEYIAMAADQEREAEASLWDAAELGDPMDDKSEDWSWLKSR
jgi:hypothetical protein